MAPFACLRADLDYVPWDTVAAEEWGHGEPAMILRLLSFARERGIRFHFFASTRVARAFPATLESILDEGHDLDWLYPAIKSIEAEFSAATTVFRKHSHALRGVAVHGPTKDPIAGAEFVSGPSELTAGNACHFVLHAPTDLHAFQSGHSPSLWKEMVLEFATRGPELTVAIRPQVLARFDPQLQQLSALVQGILALGLPLRTFRQVIDDERTTRHLEL